MDHHSLSLLTDIGLGIVFAAAAAHLARLLKQPLILGYVLGGIVLGPLGLGLVKDQASVQLISEMGLILLLFIIGLEINLRELARMGRSIFVLGAVQFLACVGLGLFFFKPFGFAFGGGKFDLLYLAVALALSSTLIVVKLLHDKFEITTVAGRVTVAILVLQDVWAIVFMAFQPNFLDPQLGPIVRSFAQGAVLVVAAFLASRHLLGRVLHAVGKTPELVLLSSIAWCFLTCGLAEKAGLSKEMGALIAGMSIAAFPYGTDVIAKLAGVRDFFVTLFFVSLGLQFPMPSWGSFGMAALCVLVVFLTRLVSVVPVAHFLGLGLRTGTVTAVNLAQISEFSLVILSLGAGYGHVTPALQNLVLTAMLLASIVSTYLILFNDSIARALLPIIGIFGLKDGKRSAAADAEAANCERDIVLLGCYREGEALLEVVEREAPDLKPRILVIDYNPALRHKIEKRGFSWAYGDLAHPETLHHLGIGGAKLMISSVSDTFLKGTSNRKLLGHLKHLAPHARMIMAAEEPAEAEHLLAAGAAHAVTPPALAGRRLYELLRESLGK